VIRHVGGGLRDERQGGLRRDGERMSTAAKAHEPTMEEILASIRRIISDDEPGQSMAPKPSTAKAPEPEAPAVEVDAIDAAEALGQDDIDAMFASFDAPEPPKAKAPEPAPAPVAPAAAAPADDIDVFELTEDMAEAPFSPPPPPQPTPVAKAPEPAPRQEPEPRWETPAPAPAYAAPSAMEDRLLSTATNDAVTGAFGALTNTILANNARTLDDIVKEMLRPMLRAWLDDNLPPLVERLVKQEIERVARGGR
jgi:cell pole-organizing protein PopZ